MHSKTERSQRRVHRTIYVEELNEAEVSKINKKEFMAGNINSQGNKCSFAVNRCNMAPEYIIEKGVIRTIEDRVEEVQKFGINDIILKGANALDINAVPAVLVQDPNGGTIGTLIPPIAVKGLKVFCPIGLEKQINEDVLEIAQIMGVDHIPGGAGMIPMPFAEPFTEIDALEMLFDCEVYHVASGGISGAEGSVSLLVIAEDDDEMKKIEELMKEIQNEPNLVL